jgi:hypothetical protein
MRTSTRRLLLLITAVAAGTGCGNATPQVHSSAASAGIATRTTLDDSGTAGTTTPVTDVTSLTAPPTTVAPGPVGWRGPAEIDALVALVNTPPANLRECLTASPFSKENDDAAVLTCLNDEVARRAYGVSMFVRSDSVPLLEDIPQDFDEFQDCISTALSSDQVYARLVEIATTARYWGPDRHGDEVAVEVIDNQFGSCWQTLALG